MYRLLEKGEVILDGDEYYSHNYGWLKWNLYDGIKTVWNENYAPVRRAQKTKELSATDNQQLKAEILRLKKWLDTWKNDLCCQSAVNDIEDIIAKLSAV
jgi:hypothetical protein